MHTANSIQPGGFNLRWRGIVLPHSLRRACYHRHCHQPSFNLLTRQLVVTIGGSCLLRQLHVTSGAMLSLDIVVLPPRTRPTPCPVKLRSPQILVCFPFLCIHCNSVDKSHPTPLLDPTTTTN
ncbi:hypothetical protein CH63R_00881 [Colletotrichum higginsianum IMI 349063]|uniref:Uncharacterized protein n=1 Tax=Colletotrichum higginsianum (strain IMI 349063) TaxID=759273 RepID=A0A1B7YUI2_COLHI|nr:hypothetical protein CH63R_00881 [Colletotrichum higginsianum IMI 349063]OBR15701.1 hypothetical protein CH63R_00881 [Colletotrichum higginsianum IMI 349063]